MVAAATTMFIASTPRSTGRDSITRAPAVMRRRSGTDRSAWAGRGSTVVSISSADPANQATVPRNRRLQVISVSSAAARIGLSRDPRS